MFQVIDHVSPWHSQAKISFNPPPWARDPKSKGSLEVHTNGQRESIDIEAKRCDSTDLMQTKLDDTISAALCVIVMS